MTDLTSAGLGDFVKFMSERLYSDVFTMEDSVRYTFFASLLLCGVDLKQVVLEHPHPFVERAETDTVILGTDQQPNVVIEFKYDRRTPGGTYQPLPQKAGAAFRDMVRLLQWMGTVNRYFVYLTDDEMLRYLSRRHNDLAPIFALSVGDSREIGKDYFTGQSDTFRNRMGEWPIQAVVSAAVNEALPQSHHVWVFKVNPVGRS